MDSRCLQICQSTVLMEINDLHELNSIWEQMHNIYTRFDVETVLIDLCINAFLYSITLKAKYFLKNIQMQLKTHLCRQFLSIRQ